MIRSHGEGVDFIPANDELSAMETTLATMALDREYVLRDFLSRVKDGYDYVLIDCRPLRYRRCWRRCWGHERIN